MTTVTAASSALERKCISCTLFVPCREHTQLMLVWDEVSGIYMNKKEDLYLDLFILMDVTESSNVFFTAFINWDLLPEIANS